MLQKHNLRELAENGRWDLVELTSSWTNQVGPSIVCARAAYAPSTVKETSCFAVFAELVRPEQVDSSAWGVGFAGDTGRLVRN